jgi:DNA-binding NarL/FixJ family response regulator
LIDSSIRALVVDDFQPLRRLICSKLLELQIEDVTEASDGEEAIRCTQELKPQLVVLDIGLPKVNGLRVARKIREFLPTAKILVASQQGSHEIVDEAFDTGAAGYVLKSDLEQDFAKAVTAVICGKKFISRSLRCARSKVDPRV